MFGTGIVVRLRGVMRRRARERDILNLEREIEMLRELDRCRAAEMYTLKSVVAVLVLEFPQFRHRLREILQEGPLIDPADPLYGGVLLATEEWRDLIK